MKIVQRIWVIVFLLILPSCTGWMASGGNTTGGEKDYSAQRLSDNGLFSASYKSDLDPAAINQIHSWVLHIETADGQPVEQASVRVQGAMPEHGHGLPTQPQVTEELGGGDYRVEGVKYSMSGWWTMTFEISAGGQTDTVTFNLVLQ